VAIMTLHVFLAYMKEKMTMFVRYHDVEKP